MSECFSERQLALFEQVVSGDPLPAVLAEVISQFEAPPNDARACILLLDRAAAVQRLGAAPSLPAELVSALDGAGIGPKEASYGRAAALREPVMVEDVAALPEPTEHRGLMLRLGVRACWSQPICARNGEVLGTFTAFCADPRGPTQPEMDALTAGARLAAVAIVRAREQQRAAQLDDRVNQLQRSERQLRSALELTRADVSRTEHPRSERPPRSDEQLRELIYRTLADILYCLSVEPGGKYRFLAVNPAFLSTMQRTEPQVIGALAEEVFSPADLPLTLAKYHEAIARSEPVSWEQLWETASGPRHSEVSITPVFDEKGRCTNLVGTVRDVTSRKQAEEEQKLLEHQLQHAQRLQALGTLTGGIAHDFNNVLAAIGGNAELGAFDLDPSQPAYECFSEIRKATRRATDLVRQILTFARQDAPSRHTLDIREVIGEVVRMLRASFPASVAFEQQLSEDTPRILADANQMHQVLMNLGTNAAHAIGGRQGKVRFSSARFTAGPPHGGGPPELTSGAVYARISISDDGCGMDDATLGRIYEPFFSTRPQGVGTGLGLSVVHGIVHHHDGAIAVDSGIGRGTTFDVYFPAREAAPVGSVGPDASSAAGANLHILFVDDEEALVFLASRLLPRVGYRVTGHSDALQALADFRVRAAEFDAVVTDMTMPGLSGPELVRELWKVRPDIPIIMTSGYLRPEDIESVRGLGVGELIPKPLSMQELTRVIRGRLGPGRG
jgi:PAS domain S-box-containing protein